MDITAPLIFLSIFVLASITLFLVYKYGIKKKSYEEALAEHRKQASALLGPRPKPKEKKNKKAKKINKERATVNTVIEDVASDEPESVDSKSVPEDTENIKSQPKAIVAKAKGTSKQTRTHVEFKEEAEEVLVEVPAENEVKEVINKKRVKKVKPILVKKSSEQEIILPTVEAPVANHFEEIHPKDEFELLRSNSRDDINKPEPPKEEPKEKKSEKPTKKNKQHKQEAQQVEKNFSAAGDFVAVEKPKEEKAVEAIVAPLVQEPVINAGKEKKKKKSEFNSRQQMTAERDQLIHSVRNAELSRTEVQLLIDLLLNKQLEAPAVIDDWSEGKSDPVQKLKKQLAEKEKQLADEQDALVGVQAKLKEVRNEQLAERAQLHQKLKAAEESKNEIIASHNRLQQKIQEMEEYRNKDLASFQRVLEENKALKMQLGQLENTLMNYQETDALIHNLKTDNDHLTNELQLLTQERQEHLTNYQNCVIQIQNLQEDLRAINDYVKDQERNHGFAIVAQQEETRKLAEQLQIASEETHRVTEQLQKASETYIKEEEKLNDIIAQLKAEIQELQEESSLQMNGSSEESKEHEVKVLNLTNELSSVKTELLAVNQSFVDAERRYQNDLSSTQEQYNQLKRELEEQKNKNNQIALEIRSGEQNAQKEFIQRLFPEIETLKSVSANDWQDEFQRLIRQHISELRQKPDAPSSSDRSAEMTRLHTEVQHYKKIIDETEGMLKKLESHIEREERKWRTELSQKDAEIQELKEQCISQLQIKVSTLESQLAQEQADKQRLLEEHQQAVNRPEIKTVHFDSTATIEKLSEEIDRLKEQLRTQQTNSRDVSLYQNGETS